MSRVIDLHAHPHMKISLFPFYANTFHALSYNGGVWNPLTFEYQYANLARSPVKLVLNNHYTVERGFLTQGLRPATRAFAWAVAPYFYHRVRTADPWQATIKQIEGLEKAVRNTNRFLPASWPRLRMVKAFADLDALGEKDIGVAHTIEGPHLFGYDLEGMTPAAFWDRTKQRLHELRARGVAGIVLGHFWDQPFVPQVDSTEMIAKKRGGRLARGRDDLLFAMKRATWKWGENHGLGEKLVREMLEWGMLCDLSHVQEHARWAIYDLAEEYGRPAIVSHVGLREFHDIEYNVTDEELRRLHQIGGVVGLICSPRLMLDPLARPATKGRGIPTLVACMRHMRETTGDVSVIAIGTDFDGFTHPFRDCWNPAHLPRLEAAMRPHFSNAEIEAIFYGNACRALERGWGPRPAKPAAGKATRRR
jgi:microsomal dipeptidase-like Zn-dependent dipeptidase